MMQHEGLDVISYVDNIVGLVCCVTQGKRLSACLTYRVGLVWKSVIRNWWLQSNMPLYRDRQHTTHDCNSTRKVDSHSSDD